MNSIIAINGFPNSVATEMWRGVATGSRTTMRMCELSIEQHVDLAHSCIVHSDVFHTCRCSFVFDKSQLSHASVAYINVIDLVPAYASESMC
eukprot:154776-Amphidinium_carterae.2